MGIKNIVLAIPMTSINSNTVGAAYQAINPNGLPFACFDLKIVNNATTDVFVSYDGVTDHDYVPFTSGFQIPTQTNAQPQNMVALFRKGLKVYVKGTAGVGFIYLVGYYQPVAN